MHIPVMPAESIELMALRPDGIYVDATTGLGGHTALIASRLTSGAVIANDRDAESLELARRFSGEESVHFINGVLDAVRKDLAAQPAVG